jgi:hypothetical protein
MQSWHKSIKVIKELLSKDTPNPIIAKPQPYNQTLLTPMTLPMKATIFLLLACVIMIMAMPVSKNPAPTGL